MPCVILDEAQNTTSMQMKMFLTRLGENSRMIVTGDPSQVDLPPGQVSGLAEAVRLLDGVEGVGHVAFTAQDVIRHELVQRIVEAYDRAAPDPRGPAMSAAPQSRKRRRRSTSTVRIAALGRRSRTPKPTVRARHRSRRRGLNIGRRSEYPADR